MARWALGLLVLALTAGPRALVAAGDPFYGVRPQFENFNPRLTEFKILAVRRLSSEFSILLVRANLAGSVNPATGEALQAEAFGLFAVNHACHCWTMTIDILASGSYLDYQVNLEQATPRFAVLSRKGATASQRLERIKYYYDLEKKKVLRRFIVTPMEVYAIERSRGFLYLLATDDHKSTVIFRLRPDDGGEFHGDPQVVDRVDGMTVAPILQVKKTEEGLALTSTDHRYALREGRWTASANPCPGSFKSGRTSGEALGIPGIRFWTPLAAVSENLISIAGQRFLVWNSRISDNSEGGNEQSGIYEISAGRLIFHKAPLRITAPAVTEIGPFEIDENRIWFGTALVDPDQVGRGAIGFFDVTTRQFRLHYVPEMSGWQASAISAVGNDIWLGLSRGSQGGQEAKVLHLDVEFHVLEARSLAQRAIVLRPVGNAIYAGTRDGFYVITKDSARRIGFGVSGSEYMLDADGN